MPIPVDRATPVGQYAGVQDFDQPRDGDTLWWVNFHRVFWTLGAFVIAAPTLEDARAIVAERYPDKASKAIIRRAPAWVGETRPRVPLSRRRPVIRRED